MITGHKHGISTAEGGKTMNKMYFNNGLRLQCLDVEGLCMEQLRRSVASFQNLLPTEKMKNRIPLWLASVWAAGRPG